MDFPATFAKSSSPAFVLGIGPTEEERIRQRWRDFKDVLLRFGNVGNTEMNFFIFFHLSRPSFLLIPLFSSSLFFPRPALSESFRILKSPFFIDFDESITDGPTDRPTDRRTRLLIEMRTHLKTSFRRREREPKE